MFFVFFLYVFNATKVEKIVYYTVTLSTPPCVRRAPTNSCHNQACYKTRIIIYYFLFRCHNVTLETVYTMINFMASFLAIIEYEVGIDSKYQS
jgi:hypothetical protein